MRFYSTSVDHNLKMCVSCSGQYIFLFVMTTVKHVKNWPCTFYLFWAWQLASVQCMISVIHTQIYSNELSEASFQTIRDAWDSEKWRKNTWKYWFEDTKKGLQTQKFQVKISSLFFSCSNKACILILYWYIIVHVSNLHGPVCKTLRDIKPFSLIGHSDPNIIVKRKIILKLFMCKRPW